MWLLIGFNDSFDDHITESKRLDRLHNHIKVQNLAPLECFKSKPCVMSKNSSSSFWNYNPCAIEYMIITCSHKLYFVHISAALPGQEKV